MGLLRVDKVHVKVAYRMDLRLLANIESGISTCQMKGKGKVIWRMDKTVSARNSLVILRVFGEYVYNSICCFRGY